MPTPHQTQTLGEHMLRRSRCKHPVAGQIRHAVFDFDGTLSLLRAGWQQIMISYFDETLAATGAEETPRTRRQLCIDFITRLTGRQTIYQCMELAQQVNARGGNALAADDYKAEYLRRLHEHIDHRRSVIASGQNPLPFLVPGALDLLERLRDQGTVCYLASGTDVDYVREEAALLGIDHYFAEDGQRPRIYGALVDFQKFSKRMVIETILADNQLDGDALVGFGDGYVEIEETLRVGGWAIAVASDETRVDVDDEGSAAQPQMDSWKQERLWQAGAHILTPDWQEHDVLLAYLGMDSR
jgi:phosphoglycolate phosphatase